MRSPTRLTASGGIAAAVAATGPVASAVAATPATTSIPQPSYILPLALPIFPGGPVQQPGTCGANQGLPPGIVNLGPTGPLGSHGPLGSGHLPCGVSIWDLGPNGPLGRGGAPGSAAFSGAQW